MGLVSLLFSFNGRINRAQYWGGTLGVTGVNFLVGMLMGASSAVSAAAKHDPAAALGASLGTLGLVFAVNSLAAWCGMALQVKRFHDRGRTGWLTAIPSMLLIWMVITVVLSAMSGAPAAQALGSIGLPFGLLMLVSLAFFIDLGCMPGKAGRNSFGDPPGNTPSAPTPDPTRPQKSAPAHANAAAASSLFSAEAAIERAIAERPAARTVARTPAAPAPRGPMTPAPAAPMGGGGGFGRRAR